jgi:hypothetical protein
MTEKTGAMNDLVEIESGSDYRLFKYRAINKHLIESLVNSRLYFARPNELNDPFDCRLDLRKSLARAANLATGARKTWLRTALHEGAEFADKWVGTFQNIGICSFSLDQRISLMWSHYADEHRGACLLYKFPTAFLLDPSNQILGVDKVKYRDDALTEWLLNEAPTELKAFLLGLGKMYLTVKAPGWQYEGEARLMRNEPGTFDVPLGFLEQVCFGLNTPSDDVELVTKLAREYCGCTKFCRIIRDENDFGITAEEM